MASISRHPRNLQNKILPFSDFCVSNLCFVYALLTSLLKIILFHDIIDTGKTTKILATLLQDFFIFDSKSIQNKSLKNLKNVGLTLHTKCENSALNYR